MIDLPVVLAAFGLEPEQIALVVFASLLVMGLVSATRAVVKPTDHWLPLIALVWGVIIMEVVGFVAEPRIDPIVCGLIGVVLGLMASGMWSQAKAITRD